MSLPQDVIVEILARSPVRSLIRFKCVCKSWYALLNNPIFISHHHQSISSKEDCEVLLVSRRDDITDKRVVSMLRSDGSDTFLDQDLPNFLNHTFGRVRLIGPCNGVVCLYGYPDNIALWNPALRDFKTLPPSLVPRPSDARVIFGDLGFGYDPITRDFKVMQILSCISSLKIIYQVEIYSLKTNSWRKYERSIPAEFMYVSLWSMVYKNETFCWLAKHKESDVEVILSFDTSKEIFQMTELPSGIEVLGGLRKITRAIMPMKEHIALVVYGLKDVEKTFNIWILKELRGNVECWTKVSSIGPISNVERLLGFWNSGEFILESSSGELVIYDPIRNEIKNFGIYGKRNRLEVVVYKESLFSVNEVYVDV